MRISDWSSDVCSSDLGLRQYGHADVNRAGDDDDVRECDVRINNRLAQFVPVVLDIRSSEARRVGKEGVSTCRYRWSPSPYNENQTTTYRHRPHLFDRLDPETSDHERHVVEEGE